MLRLLWFFLVQFDDTVVNMRSFFALGGAAFTFFCVGVFADEAPIVKPNLIRPVSSSGMLEDGRETPTRFRDKKLIFKGGKWQPVSRDD